MHVAVVGGIEGSAQNADAKTGHGVTAPDVGDDGQGRICPSPRTTYL